MEVESTLMARVWRIFLDFEANALALAFAHGVRQGKVEWKKEV